MVLESWEDVAVLNMRVGLRKRGMSQTGCYQQVKGRHDRRSKVVLANAVIGVEP